MTSLIGNYCHHFISNTECILLNVLLNIRFHFPLIEKRSRKEIDKILQEEYYGLKSSGSYFGPAKLYESLKVRGINVGLHKIRK